MKRIGQYNVRIVKRGDPYGLDDCLIHEEEKPLVEFYLASAKHSGPRGYFVSRYYAETLLEDDLSGGLSLDGDGHSVTGQEMGQVLDYIKSEVQS